MTYAIWSGKIETITVLLRKGADIQAKDTKGWTAVDHARVTGSHEIISLFENTKNR